MMPGHTLERAPLRVEAGSGPVDWRQRFGNDRPIEIEVGCGKGVFLAQVARARPDVNFVGIEIRRLRAAKIEKRIREAGLANVRLLWGDARDFARGAFAPGSVARVYLNFPDPWPKRRHAKRRIFKGEFPAWVAGILAPGGEWTLLTDVESYALEMAAAIERSRLFVNPAGPRLFSERPAEYPVSIHEEKFRKRGRSIFCLRWIKT